MALSIPLIIIILIMRAISVLIVPIGVVLLLVGAFYLIYQVYSFIYFNSQKFKKLKNSIQEYTDKCNELNRHIEELKCSYLDVKSYDYGESNFKDNSNYNFKRKEWDKNKKSQEIHNCSASVCKNASNQPFKYLCKYFNIKSNEESLERFESVLNNFLAAEQGKILLMAERDMVIDNISFSIPMIIMGFSKKKLIENLGFETIDFSNFHYPVYTFQYISPGGNSSNKCEITLELDNLEKFINYLSELVKFRGTIAGQRALMTSKLREKIKLRDSHMCKNCGLSTEKEPNLLLEIDHIIPLSKGGITSEDNLQTLCWKCNRSKGSKIMI